MNATATARRSARDLRTRIAATGADDRVLRGLTNLTRLAEDECQAALDLLAEAAADIADMRLGTDATDEQVATTTEEVATWLASTIKGHVLWLQRFAAYAA